MKEYASPIDFPILALWFLLVVAASIFRTFGSALGFSIESWIPVILVASVVVPLAAFSVGYGASSRIRSLFNV